MVIICSISHCAYSLELSAIGGCPSPFDGHVEIDASGTHCDDHAHQEQEDVEDVPGHGGMPPLEHEVEERREDERQHGGGETTHQC